MRTVIYSRPGGGLAGLLLLSLLSSLLLFAPGVARADPDPGLVAAKKAFTLGQQLYIQKAYVKAAAAFLEAYKAKPIPAFLFNAAVAFEKGKAYKEAVKHFKLYLVKAPKASDAAQIKKRIAALEKAIKDAQPRPEPRPKRRVVEPPPRPGDPPRPRLVEPRRRAVVVVVPVLPEIKPKGVVVISTKPLGAMIYLNNKMTRLGPSPWEGSLETGDHRLIIEYRGYKPEKKTISVSPDRLVDVYVALSREHYLGWVQITADTPGALVYIDKKEFGAIGRTPYTGFLKPGKHKIWVRKTGYSESKKVIDVVSGETHKVHLSLKKLKHGWLTIAGATGYGAQVLLNGKKLCKVPCDRVVVQPGKHRLEIHRKGHKPIKSDVIVRRLRLHTARIKLAKKPSLVSAFVAYGFAAGLLAGGIALGYLSRQIQDDIKSDISNNVLVNSSDARFQKGKIYAYIANGMFGLAGIAAIFGVYYTFADRGPKSLIKYYEKRIGVTPQIGPAYAGLRGQWRW
jgi:hypothetical protein